MLNRPTDLIAILASIVFGVSGQLALKAGVMRTSIRFSTKPDLVLVQYVRALLNPLVLVGLVCFAIGMLIWLYVLSQLDLSVAFPFLGLNYVLIMLGSRILFQEPITVSKLIGTGLVVAGVVLLGKN